MTRGTRLSAPHLPVEVCEWVIDIVYFRQDRAFQRDLTGLKVEKEKAWQNTLIACALVSKDWHPRSRYHLDRAIYLSSSKQVRQLSKRMRSARSATSASTAARPASHIIIRGEARAGSHYAPASHLGTFAAMLARELPGAAQLTLSSIDWRASMVQPRCLHRMAVFRGITRLALLSTRVQALASMPGVRTLSCVDVRCAQASPAEHPAARYVCSAPRELELAWTDRAVAAFLGDVAIAVPPVEVLTVRLYARGVADGDLLACHRLLGVYASSLIELRLFIDGEAGDSGPAAMPGTDLPRCALTSLRRITLGHLFQSRGNDFTWIPSLFSSITPRALSHIHIILKPMVILSKAGGTSCAERIKDIEENGGLRLLDDALSLEQSVDIPKLHVTLEIKTLSTWHAALSKALERRGGWERFVKDQMPKANSRENFHCVQTTVREFEDLSES